MVRIADEEIADAFNLECADILNEWEQEREAGKERRLLGALGVEFSDAPKLSGQYGETITPANFRDQGF